jgi:hypothetical protein
MGIAGTGMRMRPAAMFAGPGCPLCQAAESAASRHLTWFLIENYYAGPTLQRLVSSRYCPRHAASLVRDRHPQLAGTCQWLAQVELSRLRRWRRMLGDPGRSRRRAVRLPPDVRPADQPAACPACAAAAGEVAVRVTEMVAAFADAAYRDAYVRSDGFCMPHLWQVLRESPADVAAWLAATAELRLAALLADLELYFHRLDHRFADEPQGEEQDAWRRGVSVFWPVAGSGSVGEGRDHGPTV